MKVRDDEGVANGVANKSVGSEGCESSHHDVHGQQQRLRSRIGEGLWWLSGYSLIEDHVLLAAVAIGFPT